MPDNMQTEPTVAEAVANMDLFLGLDQTLLDSLAGLAVFKVVRKGEVIFTTGDQAAGLYCVAQGRVRVYRAAPSGKEQILHIFGPGATFGEVAVFQGGVFPASAQALERSRLLFFSRKDMVKMIAGDPEIAMSMLSLMSMRLKGFVRMVEELSLKEVPARLASHLLLLRATQDSDRIELTITKGQLASYLGTIPETLSRVLAKLAKQGYISQDRKGLDILDVPGLEALAEGLE